MNHVPSTAYEYSNSNYDVLGHLIEAVTGQSYGDYLENHLFQPLEMTHSFTLIWQRTRGGDEQQLLPFSPTNRVRFPVTLLAGNTAVGRRHR